MTQLVGAPPRPAATDIVHASSIAEVQSAVRSAAASAAPVRIAGAGTWLGAGRPVATPLTVSVRPLAGIVEYVPGDLTITAWAGTSLDELDRVIAEHGQWLALDPFGTRAGTLGATVATASYGPLAASFGTPRDVVLGVQCVTGDGEVVQGGARVVKHVAGFDLVRLMTGAWGTLGVITALTLRLRARAPVDSTFAVALGSAPLREWFVAYRAASVSPLAAELLSATTAGSLGFAPETVALIRVSGNDEAVAAQELALRELGSMRDVPAHIWHTFGETDPALPAAAVRFSQRSAQLPDVWEHAEEVAAALATARVHATLDRGVARVVFPAIGAADLAERLARPARVPCACVCEALPAELWPRVAPSAADTPLARRVRDAFDPERRLNPGILGEA
ncbi:MAG: FAD-binding oxidoreductase [Gemmatimonadaceae bacterium]